MKGNIYCLYPNSYIFIISDIYKYHYEDFVDYTWLHGKNNKVYTMLVNELIQSQHGYRKLSEEEAMCVMLEL